MRTAAGWWDDGDTLRLAGRRVFRSRRGHGRTVSFLHGYPASSLEWSALVDRLVRFDALTVDLVGFGASEKPWSLGAYDIDRQTDVVEALWTAEGIGRTAVVAYDLGAIVAQELLARRAEGRLAVEIDAVVMLNAGLDHRAYRPTRTQRLLATAAIGDALSLSLPERRLRDGWNAVLGAPLDDAVIHEHWQARLCGGGRRVGRQQLSYIRQRERRAGRWEGVLDASAPVRALVWGMADPVSGPAVLQAVRPRLPQAEVFELDGVGHAPHLEAPDYVAQILEAVL